MVVGGEEEEEEEEGEEGFEGQPFHLTHGPVGQDLRKGGREGERDGLIGRRGGKVGLREGVIGRGREAGREGGREGGTYRKGDIS